MQKQDNRHSAATKILRSIRRRIYKNARRRIRRFEPRQGTSFATYSKTSKIAGGGSNAQIFFRPKIRRYLGNSRHYPNPRGRSRFPRARNPKKRNAK